MIYDTQCIDAKNLFSFAAWEDVLCATNSGGAHYYNGQ